MSYINLHTNSMDGNGNIIGSGMFMDWIPNSGETLSTYYVSGIEDVQLKMFVPPGTVQVTVTYNCQYNTMYLDDITQAGSIEIRWGSEVPDAPTYVGVSTYSGTLSSNFGYAVSQDGTNMSIVLRSDSAITSGEWLYIWIVNSDSDTSHKQFISSYVTVDMETYSDWFYKSTWDDEGNPTSYGDKPVVTYPHIDPYLDALNTGSPVTYPVSWGTYQYPWSQPFPYPFGE